MIIESFLEELEKIAASALRKRLTVEVGKVFQGGRPMVRYQLMLGDKAVAVLHGLQTPAGFQAKEMRAVGGHRLGQKLYGEVLKREGKILSDAQVSSPAVRMIARTARSPGVQVQRTAPVRRIGHSPTWGGRYYHSAPEYGAEGPPLFSSKRLYSSAAQPAPPLNELKAINPNDYRMSLAPLLKRRIAGYKPGEWYWR